MASVAQLAALIDFMDTHKDLALGYSNRSKEGRSLAKRLWVQCSATLNSVSADGVQKTPDQWRLYYNEFKSKLLKKIKAQKSQIAATDGGPTKPIILTPLQQRLHDILGRDVGEQLLLGFRIDPSKSENNSALAVSSESVQNSSAVDPMETEAMYLQEIEIENPIKIEPDSVSTNQEPDLIRPPSVNELPDSHSTLTASKRRRRRQKSRRHVNTEQQSSSQTIETLESLKRKSVQAMLEQAQATREQAQATRKQAQATREQALAISRLAGALETIAERLIPNSSRSNTYHRINMSSSDSEDGESNVE